MKAITAVASFFFPNETGHNTKKKTRKVCYTDTSEGSRRGHTHTHTRKEKKKKNENGLSLKKTKKRKTKNETMSQSEDLLPFLLSCSVFVFLKKAAHSHDYLYA